MAIVPGGLSFIAAVPAAGLGALLMVAAVELGLTKRLWTAKPSCWPVIGITALITFWADPFFGFLVGVAAETFRSAWLRGRFSGAHQD